VAIVWQQLNLLSEPARENVKIEKIEDLATELVKADATTINQTIKAHRLNERETELFMELLQVNYILD
jgi:hypothetical protein